MVSSRRDIIRSQLLERARADDRVAAAAITGSAARQADDEWSDVDLFFGVLTNVDEVLADFSDYLYADAGALHHFDLATSSATYRAFLLEPLLEVDLGFTPMSEFRAQAAAPFRVMFGTPQPAAPSDEDDADHRVGLIWHHVLHARNALARGQLWQSEYWISAVRDQVVALACRRYGYPTMHARGADLLAPAETTQLEQALVQSLDQAELSRALQAVTRAAVRELQATDASAADRLRGPLFSLSAVGGS